MVGIKKFLVYLAIFAIAIGAGSAISGIASQFNALSWLAITPSFGFDPFQINLVVLDFTLGLNIHLSVAHIIMIIIAIFASPKLVATLVKAK
jgi:hypothetical protein